jgi:hypothetical protein
MRGQWLGLAVGLVAGVGLTLGVLGVLALAGAGGDEKQNVRARPARPRPAVHTLRTGDTARRPAAATTCVASVEAAAPNLYCTRIGGGRFAVAFYEDSFLVWRDPDHAQSFRWKR